MIQLYSFPYVSPPTPFPVAEVYRLSMTLDGSHFFCTLRPMHFQTSQGRPRRSCIMNGYMLPVQAHARCSFSIQLPRGKLSGSLVKAKVVTAIDLQGSLTAVPGSLSKSKLGAAHSPAASAIIQILLHTHHKPSQLPASPQQQSTAQQATSTQLTASTAAPQSGRRRRCAACSWPRT